MRFQPAVVIPEKRLHIGKYDKGSGFMYVIIVQVPLSPAYTLMFLLTVPNTVLG